jgi:FMN phosphatase YigB (HAD superfamily)
MGHHRRNVDDGQRWRAEYLKITYAEGRYRAYETLVREAALAVRKPSDFADRLVERYSELAPWPEVQEVLGALQGQVPMSVVTNCSETLGRIAVARTGISSDTIVTAERAGFYKPDPRPIGSPSTNSVCSRRIAYYLPPLSASRCSGMTASALRCRRMRHRR